MLQFEKKLNLTPTQDQTREIKIEDKITYKKFRFDKGNKNRR